MQLELFAASTLFGSDEHPLFRLVQEGQTHYLARELWNLNAYTHLVVRLRVVVCNYQTMFVQNVEVAKREAILAERVGCC